MKHSHADALALEQGRLSGRLLDYVELTKPRLNMLVVATSGVGYYLGARGGADWWPMAQAVIGTALVAGGSSALNQLYERDTDAMMRRTRMRPLPDGRIAPEEARRYGVALSAAGLGMLAVTANLLAALVALATLLLYLGVYTPMKRRSPAATFVGAIPGALPPLIGWAAATDSLSIGGWSLAAIVFFWQVPHFMAIAWLCRDDYRQAGFPMLPVIEPEGRRASRQALLYATALVPASLIPTLLGVSGGVYFGLAIALGAAMVWLALQFALLRTDATARALFFVSIVYLPLIWVAMIANRL